MLFDHPEYAGHEDVHFCHDEATGLRAIIAIHDRTLGPAAGGCRMRAYASDDEAVTDVLRLSKAMTWKNALAGLPLGGGKSVIIADPHTDKNPALLRAFAAHVQRLAGSYWTAEDIGVGPADVDVLASASDYIFGVTRGTGDPSAFTAGGCFQGLVACLDHRFGGADLAGRHVAIQGVGNVGFELARMVHEAGGRLTVADVTPGAVQRCVDAFGAATADIDEIHAIECDVFAPCAIGATVNEATIAAMRAPIVCGVANNQLATPADGRRLRDAGILYAPDYVVNAGGMMHASGDIFGAYDPAAVGDRIAGIRATMADIARRADAEDAPTSDVADAMARARVAAGAA
ncbi:Glu/Leu/Phe/Val dehydrogenase dimerization domain-containing protein [Mariniluteicoccus flavus]